MPDVGPDHLSWIAWAVVVLIAAVLRSRTYATMLAILLGLANLVWMAVAGQLPPSWRPGLWLLQGATVLHFISLVRPRLRRLWFRGLISIPGLWFAAGSLLALPWAVVAATGLTPHGWWIPYGLCALGVVQSLRNPRGTIDVVIDNRHDSPFGRAVQSSHQSPTPLCVFQITDPHLGPFMSKGRLRRICRRAVAHQPDLVFLTGDLLTMESHGAVDALRYGLEPLAELSGRVFACFGNHDHEARATVREALAQIGAVLLVDAHTTVGTRHGEIEIVGADFSWRHRAERLEKLFAEVGPRTENRRILMLHDPGAFKYVPPGAADVVLAGHTHGGQLGLVTFGLPWTVVSALSSVPDHGLWAHGPNRMYVHRGTGHYGFPVRLGVPGEESLMRLHFVDP